MKCKTILKSFVLLSILISFIFIPKCGCDDDGFKTSLESVDGGYFCEDVIPIVGNPEVTEIKVYTCWNFEKQNFSYRRFSYKPFFDERIEGKIARSFKLNDVFEGAFPTGWVAFKLKVLDFSFEDQNGKYSKEDIFQNGGTLPNGRRFPYQYECVYGLADINRGRYVHR